MGDEPIENLDSENTGSVFDRFKELSVEQQQTVLIVTHDEEFVK